MFELFNDVVSAVTEICNSLCIYLVIGAGAALLLLIIIIVAIVMCKRRKLGRTEIETVNGRDPAHTTIVTVSNSAMTSYDGYSEILRSVDEPKPSTTPRDDPDYLQLDVHGDYIHPPVRPAPALANL